MQNEENVKRWTIKNYVLDQSILQETVYRNKSEKAVIISRIPWGKGFVRQLLDGNEYLRIENFSLIPTIVQDIKR